MADVEDIRRGLAALLRTVLDHDEGHVSPYFDPSPKTPCLQVAGIRRIERTDMGDGRLWEFVIEGVFSLAGGDRGAQVILDRLLATNAVDEAVESDETGGGALFSRLQDDGSILTDQPAAAYSVGFLEFAGAGRTAGKTGADLLTANWIVQVQT